jgi:subtilisin family serine protease/streptogramin lyase
MEILAARGRSPDNRSRRAVWLRLVSGLVLSIASLSAISPQERENARFRRVRASISGQYIVILSRSASPNGVADRVVRLQESAAAAAAGLTTRYGGRIRHVYERGSLRGFSGHMSETAALALSQDPAVDFVEEVGETTAAGVQVNPPWGLDRIDQLDRPLDSLYAMALTGPLLGVVVIDSGIRTTHIEFEPLQVVNTYNAVRDEPNIDCNGHGTRVASIIAGRTVGVARGTHLSGIKVLGCDGRGTTDELIDGILHVPNDAAIVNVSIEASGSDAVDQAISEVIAANRFVTGGETIFVVAAGDGNTDAGNVSPARMTVPGVITVGATNRSDQRWEAPDGRGSNYGPRLDLFAPGADILSATAESDTALDTASGTSLAAPYVTGAIALRLHQGPAGQVLERASVGQVFEENLGSPNRLLFVGSTLASFSLVPSTVVGGCETAVGQVHLEAGAPSGGAAVGILSSSVRLIAPSVVTVPPGQTSQSFVVRTAPVSTPTSGALGATFDLEMRVTDAITILPPGVRSITLTPNPATAGTVVTGRVTLDCPGLTPVRVNLSTSNLFVAAPVPSALDIPAGATEASFTVVTRGVPTATTVLITATRLPGTAASAPLTVIPGGGGTPPAARLTYLVTDGDLSAAAGTIFRFSAGGRVTTLATLTSPPQDIASDADGNLFVTLPFRQQIVRITPDGAVSTLFSGSPLAGPLAIVVDHAGNIIVGDNHADAVFRISPDGRSISEIARVPATPRQAQSITLAIDADGSVLVASSTTDGGPPDASVVLRVRTDGVVTTLFSGTAIMGPSGMVVEPSGDLVIADFRQNALIRLTPAGNTSVIAQGGALCCNLVGLERDPATGDFISLLNFQDRVVRISAGGTVTTLHSGSPLTFPHGILVLPDSDLDGLPDAWERRFGLNAASSSGGDGGAGDVDGDGATNADEYVAGTHPRGFHTRYLAEGAANAFFDSRIALLNANVERAHTLLRFLHPGGSVTSAYRALEPNQRATVDPETITGALSPDFSTVIESDAAVIVDRTMFWGAGGYGAHAETSSAAPSTTWYLAEGSTSGDFALFYLLQNPNPRPTTATITYLRPSGLPPLVRSYDLAANSRTTVAVDEQGPELSSTDVSAVVTASDSIIVERAMYLSRPGEPFSAGHGSIGVTEPAASWFLAEGATGPFFDLFVLIANPMNDPARVDVRYLTSSGAVLTKSYVVRPNSRFTIWVDDEDSPGLGKALANAAVSTTVTASHSVIVERAMWWPGPELTASYWYEAHNSAGATTTGTRWALAEGELGGLRSAETYILLANTSQESADVRVTLMFEDATTADKTFRVQPTSRFNVQVSSEFPAAAGRRFGALVESLGTSPAALVVERAMYFDAGGVVWSAGTNALATRLP